MFNRKTTIQPSHILQAYQTYDIKGEMYSLPWYETNDECAKRSFKHAVNDDRTEMFRDPGDFELFHCGEYDKLTGDFEKSAHKTSLGLAVHYKTTAAPLPTGVEIPPRPSEQEIDGVYEAFANGEAK